ncbi:MAG: hypothetical protein ABSG03_13250 [Bryobacteraceae bacterium]|jgi:peptidoglycan hydrolase CwlO-like protein
MEDQNAPATKADIAAVKADIAAVKADVTAVKADMTEVKQDIEQLRSEVNHGYNDLVERMADSETRLLKAFYDFAQSNLQCVTLLEGN